MTFKCGALIKGVTGGPSGPSREGPDVGQKIVSDTKQMTKERKRRNGKREKCEKKKMEEREKWTEINTMRYKNALRHGQIQKYLFDR